MGVRMQVRSVPFVSVHLEVVVLVDHHAVGREKFARNLHLGVVFRILDVSTLELAHRRDAAVLCCCGRENSPECSF